MITAETIQCSQIVKPPNFAGLFGNWVNTFECDYQTDPFGPGFWVQLLAAVATVAAVCVALKQSGEARRLAEEGHTQAISRELMARQWDRYEDFSRESVLMMQHLNVSSNAYATLMTNQTHAGNAYAMYLSIDQPELSEAVINYSDALQAIGSTVNQLNAAAVAEEEFDGSVIDWARDHPRLQQECMQNTALLINVLRSYYQKQKTAEEATKELEMCLEIIVNHHMPLLTYYEKDRPVFMRRYSS